MAQPGEPGKTGKKGTAPGGAGGPGGEGGEGGGRGGEGGEGGAGGSLLQQLSSPRFTLFERVLGIASSVVVMVFFGAWANNGFHF